jgi:S1-C subfamily serine protease
VTRDPADRARRGAPRARALWALAVAAFLGLVILAGCGDDDDSGGATAASSESGEGDVQRVVVEAEEGAFDAQAIYESASPGVVTVTSILGGQDLGGLFGPGGGGPAAGQGAGFVISEDGEIVTNAHVVTDAQASGPNADLDEAREVYVQFPDRNQVPAEILGFDAFADVALLEVDPEGLDMRPLEFADSDQVEVGDEVAAIGSPFGQASSLSVGVVSANDRSIESLTDFQIDQAIQTDASINPGNSGGPLLDANGRVIGINQQINTRSGGNEGVGFAVPSNLVRRSIDDLRDDGEATYPYIGVSAQPLYPQLAEELGLDAEVGSLIDEVVPESPADEAGLQGGEERFRFQGQQVSRGGDVIVAVNGEELLEENDLPVLIAEHEPGDEVTLEVIHADGDREDVTVELEERPATLPGSG